MKVLRSVLAYVNVLFFFFVFTALFPVCLIFRLFRFDSYFLEFGFVLMRVGIGITLWLAGIKVVVTKDNGACLSGKGGAVIMGNHVAATDPIFLIYIFTQPFVVVAKRSLFNVPFLNLVLISVGTIPVNRSSIKSSANAQKMAIDVIKEGRFIGIFPEGTRNRGGEVGKFKRGAMNLALRTNSSIVPVTLLNTHKVFIKNFILNTGLSVYVHVHSPIDVFNLRDDEKENLHVTVRDRIVEKLAKMKVQYGIDRDINEDK
ncbi:lysophospholipid acyltransferase family protein [Borrelia sp. BU AG58]|uniref:lysophospholipid acyltransferase family protein n=1 Tax=Borrelia sp. BU AG58 TaxID=2887345 RepID=UPI001E5B2731|nr:lysophospholipid acyltransferase family protein [Borrelia sp. BU AG58]UER67259.1 lysophospholipid acyltransferase family protein [Borrelia sp. BU AG58]